MTTKQFDITIQDKPGEIATVADALAKNAVNIKGVSTEKGEKNATLHIISEDEDGTRKALKAAKVKLRNGTSSLFPCPTRRANWPNSPRSLQRKE